MSRVCTGEGPPLRSAVQLGRTNRRFVQSHCFGEHEVLNCSVKGTLVGGVLGWEGDVPSVGLNYRSKPGEVKKLREDFRCEK